MPANLTPEYREAELRFRDAESLEEKIEALKHMISVLPKHKGTDHLFGDLKSRLAKLTAQEQQQRKSGARTDLFKVEKQGAGQVVLVGPPNSGKSCLVSRLTSAHTEVAVYPFTTQLPIPGMMDYEDIQIQMVDTAPITADYFPHWLSGLLRKSDLVLLVLDLGDDSILDHLEQLTTLLMNAKVALFPTTEPLPLGVAGKKTLVIANKIDLPDAETRLELLRDALPDQTACFAVSAEHGQGLESLRVQIFRALNLVRVYTKIPGQKPDMKAPFALPVGSTVLDLARTVHKDFAEGLKFARIWGSGQFDGQPVAREHVLADRDVVELHL